MRFLVLFTLFLLFFTFFGLFCWPSRRTPRELCGSFVGRAQTFQFQTVCNYCANVTRQTVCRTHVLGLETRKNNPNGLQGHSHKDKDPSQKVFYGRNMREPKGNAPRIYEGWIIRRQEILQNRKYKHSVYVYFAVLNKASPHKLRQRQAAWNETAKTNRFRFRFRFTEITRRIAAKVEQTKQTNVNSRTDVFAEDLCSRIYYIFLTHKNQREIFGTHSTPASIYTESKGTRRLAGACPASRWSIKIATHKTWASEHLHPRHRHHRRWNAIYATVKRQTKCKDVVPRGPPSLPLELSISTPSLLWDIKISSSRYLLHSSTLVSTPRQRWMNPKIFLHASCARNCTLLHLALGYGSHSLSLSLSLSISIRLLVGVGVSLPKIGIQRSLWAALQLNPHTSALWVRTQAHSDTDTADAFLAHFDLLIGGFPVAQYLTGSKWSCGLWFLEPTSLGSLTNDAYDPVEFTLFTKSGRERQALAWWVLLCLQYSKGRNCTFNEFFALNSLLNL